MFDGNSLRKIPTPDAWQQSILSKFELAKLDETFIVPCNAYLEMMNFIPLSTSVTKGIMSTLDEMIRFTLKFPTDNKKRAVFSLGAGLKRFLHDFVCVNPRLPETFPQIIDFASQYGTLPLYLESVLYSVKSKSFKGADIDTDQLIGVLVENLHSSFHLLRKLSLQILEAFVAESELQEVEILKTAVAIESSPLDLQSARVVSMNIRKMAFLYKALSPHRWLQKAIPHFCFGLLTFKLSQIWDDAIFALRDICETKTGEEIVSDLAFRWLEETEPTAIDNYALDSESGNKILSHFQCSNLMGVERLIQDEIAEMSSPMEHLTRKFDEHHRILSRNVRGSPNLAIRVLSKIPQVAEKYSRLLVPKFLKLVAKETTEDLGDPLDRAELFMSQQDRSASQRFSRKDRKAILDLFGSFKNPRVLYRASDVFDALRDLLANGDNDIQKSALKAISCWKIRGLQPYQENLMNLLDDARFREEISTFLQSDDTIQDEHRQDLTPILLRILYGKMIAKAGTASGKRGQSAKRKAVLGTLSRMGETDLREFVLYSLRPLDTLEILDGSNLREESMANIKFHARKQVGLLNMMRDMLETLGNKIAPFTHSLIEALLYCMIKANRGLSLTLGADGVESAQLSLLKNIRQVGMQCLVLMFQHCITTEIEPYMHVIFADLIIPRLEKFPSETSQSISGLLILFSTWASSPEMAHFLVDYDQRLVQSIADCLQVPSAKEEVKMYVLDEILKNLVRVCKGPSLEVSGNDQHLRPNPVAQRLLHPNTDVILNGLGELLRKSPSKEFLRSTIELVSMMAPMIKENSHVGRLLEVSTFLLDQPSHRVNPRSKGELLLIIQHFIPLVDLSSLDGLQDRIYSTVSSLFGYFNDRANRQILSRVLLVLARVDLDLQDVARLCVSLNSFSERKMDEPDFDERLKAFNNINESQFKEFSPKEWPPLVYNMLYYVRDTEELAIRSNASFALRRFVETNKYNAAEERASSFVKAVLLPALRNGAFESSELVRAEFLSLMAHLIRHNPDWEEICDMHPLLVNEDDEASFFGNILHIQQHRRLRALRRLASHARQHGLHSVNVAHFFIPLVEHFIFNTADGEGAHYLTAETISTIGALESSLEWSQFRALFRRYSSYISNKPDLEKTVIKLLGVTIDAMAEAAESRQQGIENIATPIGTLDKELPKRCNQCQLSATIPKQERLANDLTNNLLPSLLQYLHDKDESTVSLRVPVAVSTVKLLKILPPDQLKERLPAVLTDVCNILRSRSQESRDVTRKTLVEISSLIGPTYFGFVLKELRSALARGYQLHVLSFTMHAILVAIASNLKPGDLNYCVSQIVSIIMDDIFGVAGLEKDAEEYISKMREVKSSKSYDSMELLTAITTIQNFGHLVRPIQALLEEKLDLKMVRKIDELLRRISVGMLRNKAIEDQQALVFCHEVIQGVYEDGNLKNKTSRDDQRNKRFLVNSRGANKSGNRGSTSSYRYKLARFSLDLLRTILHKYDSFRTPVNISGFIPIINKAAIDSNEEVQIAALRLIATIIKVPLQEIDDNVGFYIAECVKIFKTIVSTHSELAQAALKLVSAILRERKTVQIREIDIAYLLKRLLPDLEMPDRQGGVFSFLKAVLSRKIIITEIYEILDTVATIMVTNQTKAARDLARTVYFQFLMEYPQGKSRFSKQLSFLVQNLDYKHQEGRQSVMEIIHLLLLKVGEDMTEEITDTFTVPLVLVMVNDDSAICREMAGTLLRTSFERADAKRARVFLKLFRAWLDQSDQPVLARAALQLYCMLIDMQATKVEDEIPILSIHISQILKRNVINNAESDWELMYFALQTFYKMSEINSSSVFGANFTDLWTSVRQCLSFPHTWVKLSAAKLLGSYFADFARKNANIEEPELPLHGSGSQLLTNEVISETAKAFLAILRVPNISEELATQSVRNLIFLGKIMSKTSMLWWQQDQHVEFIHGDTKDIDEKEDEGEESAAPADSKTAIAFLLQRISAIIRRGPSSTKSPSLIPLKASLQLIGAFSTHLSVETLSPNLETILLPLHNLTDSTIPHPFSHEEAFTTGYKTLVSNSSEILALLQKKLGTTEFVNRLSKVREEVKRRREGRRMKRRIEAVAEPERWGKDKVRRGERKKERRKEKGMGQRSLRRGW